MAGQHPPGPDHPGRRDVQAPRPSYYVRNPWRSVAAGAFAGCSTILTVTAIFYALGRLPLGAVGISVVLAVVVFGFGLFARQRAARIERGMARPPGA
ncbi:hypothetical protein [Pseudoxanthomonas sp.]|uniref:hypothetical protein n=1 Tax=Pseudoxanthomonas sp. TaxID=1871049 RepID=UPI002590089D|nr:hypothetical protein [Pseudoxanthomonas sp.]MCR6686355.1 hypothetical protein [Pseudoxanthomonas sp.]